MIQVLKVREHKKHVLAINRYDSESAMLKATQLLSDDFLMLSNDTQYSSVQERMS